MSSDFVRDIEDAEVGVAIDARGGSRPVLVCFGGIAGGLMGPPFEFLRMTANFDITRVFVRDLEQSWYQRGISGLGTTVPQAATALDRLLDELGSARRVFVGVSSGGYAAILYSTMIGASRVVAFSPQTTILRGHRLVLRDMRWKNEIRAARRNAVERSHLDLVAARAKGPHHPQTTIYYGLGDRRDMSHALRMCRCDAVKLESRPGGHTITRSLRDSGQLTRILATALDLDGV